MVITRPTKKNIIYLYFFNERIDICEKAEKTGIKKKINNPTLIGV